MKTPRHPGQQKPNHILCFAQDDFSCHAMTEELLDTWWANLSPEEKADAYLTMLGDPQAAPAPAWIQEGLDHILARPLAPGYHTLLAGEIATPTQH